MTNLLCGFSHEHKSLGVRNDFGSVEGLLEIIDEQLFVTTEWLFLWAGNNLAGAHTLVLDSRQATRENGFANESD